MSLDWVTFPVILFVLSFIFYCGYLHARLDQNTKMIEGNQTVFKSIEASIKKIEIDIEVLKTKSE